MTMKSCHDWTQGVAEAQPEWAMEEQFWVNKLMPALKVSDAPTTIFTHFAHFTKITRPDYGEGGQPLTTSLT